MVELFVSLEAEDSKVLLRPNEEAAKSKRAELENALARKKKTKADLEAGGNLQRIATLVKRGQKKGGNANRERGDTLPTKKHFTDVRTETEQELFFEEVRGVCHNTADADVGNDR